MNLFFSAPYLLAGQLARAVAALAPAGGGKLQRSLHARRGIRARFELWGARGRDRTRPLLWVHAPSVGEGLMAAPVIARLRERHADWQIAYTFYSPSAESFAARVGADFHDYLPFDTAGDAEVALASLAPTAIVYSKLDLWPVLTLAAAARAIPVGMISASLTAGSGRASAFAARLLAPAYRSLAAVGAASEDDAARLVTLGVFPDRISITGDTRYDQVWARMNALDTSAPWLAALANGRPTVVAGSTWPSDESVLFDSWQMVRAAVPDARMIIAPHETTDAHIEAIERQAQSLGLIATRLGAPDEALADVVIVDRVGVLAELYSLSTVAFVGGGFHGKGLHSVVEPAAFGAPVLFGPQHHNSRDARELLAQGGALSVSKATSLGAEIIALLTDGPSRNAMGALARNTVGAGLGAVERSAALVERLMR